MRCALVSLCVAFGILFGGCSSKQVPVVVIEKSTNHKSPDRIEFAEHILRSRPSPVATSELIHLGVVEFENEGTSAKYARFGGAAAALLIDGLASHGQFQIVERTGEQELLSEKSLSAAGLVVDKTEVMSEAGSVASDFIVTGSYVMDTAKLSVSVSLVDVSDGKPVAEWKASGTVAAMPDVVVQLVSGIAGYFGVKDASHVSKTETPPSAAPLVAILELSNLSASTRLEPMEAGFGEILQANLSTIDGVRLVERQRIHDVLEEQRLGLSGAVDPKTAARAGRLLGAERLVYGSFFELDKRLHLQVRLVDVKSTAVLQSASVEGDVEQFESIMLELTKRIGSALATLPPDVAERLQREQPVHALESALHYARGQDLRRRGRLESAAEAYAQALVVEPRNAHLHQQRCEALYHRGAYTELTQAAQQALQQDFAADRREVHRWSFYVYLINACWQTRDFSRLSDLTRQAMEEFHDPKIVQSARHARAVALMALGRWDEGAELLEKAVSQAKDQEGDISYIDNLQKLLNLYWKESQRGVRRQQLPEERQESVRRGLRVYNELLRALSGRRDEHARRAGLNAFHFGTSFGWEDENDWRAGQEQKLKSLQSGLAVLDWIPQVAGEGYFELAEVFEEREQWADALDAHHKFQQADYAERDTLPCIFDWMPAQPNSWLDKQIESSYRIGKILETGLQRKEESSRAYQQVVEKFGLANFRGPEVVAALHRLGVRPSYSANSVLVWGGATDVRTAYAHLLAESKCDVHSVRGAQMTLAHLIPYRLVILARSGHRVYTPGEILALRTYVATGGSLLVILSPGWEPAAPSMHNALLSFFGASVGDKFAEREYSTEIRSHPITRGVERVMVKNLVGINVPTEAQLVRCHENTVLAAMTYGRGRVVLAAFGQWFLPDPNIPSDWPIRRWGQHWSHQVPVAKLPIESGSFVHQELLKNVVAWLTENTPHDSEAEACRLALREAANTAITVEASALPWDALQPAVSHLEQAATGEFWKEEVLWAAGELFQQLQYEPSETQYCVAPPYGMGTNWGLANPEYYQRLIQQFPASPLRPFAQWRLGECARRVQLAVSMKERSRNSVFPSIYEADPGAPLPVFAQVTADEGSFAWAWSQLRLGMLHAQNRAPETAVGHFENVSERLSHGPEKAMALMSLGLCYWQLGRKDDAIRQFELVGSFPNILWDLHDPYTNWRPAALQSQALMGSSHELASRYLAAMARNK